MLDRFIIDMKKRNIISNSTSPPSGLALAMLIMDHYIVYPVDNSKEALLPFNYCMLPKKTPLVF